MCRLFFKHSQGKNEQKLVKFQWLQCKWTNDALKETMCRNPNLGLTTKARACKGVSQKWSLRVTFHALGSVGECEGMNPHTPKRTPTLGVGVSMDSQIFKRQLQASKLFGLKSSLCCWKSLGTLMSKMSLHDPFGYLQHKLWPKERLGVKLPIWLPTTKSQESP
jgi:hypothetical protein